MSDQIQDPTEFIQPLVNLIITTYELSEDTSENPIWKSTVTHVFTGETEERVYQIMEAHRTTDAFFAASFKGVFPWKGGDIYLKNSEIEIVRKDNVHTGKY